MAPPPPTLRIARPCNNIAALSDFYTQGLGLEILSSFKDHNGFDGVILGHPGYQWHLEFTYQHGVTVERAPTKEHLIAFYEPDREKWEELVRNVESVGAKRVQSENPWWEQHGVTVEDPEGWRVVLWHGSWPSGKGRSD
jgi:catechol 2,3-dioxygenase-like lactoylglutathione lyase family enzyme